MAALFVRQLLFSDIPSLIDKAKSHPRRTVSISILLVLSIGFIIIVSTPTPGQPEMTKEQRETEEHLNHAICGDEFDRIVKETHDNCDLIKARKDRLPSFVFELLKTSIEQKKGLRALCCEDRCNRLEIEELECWEMSSTSSPSPPSSSPPSPSPSPPPPSLLFFLLALGGIFVLIVIILVVLWAFRRARSVPTDAVPLI